MMYEFKVSEMAEEFGVHRNTIRNWIHAGTLRAKEGPGRKYLMAFADYEKLCEKFGRTPHIRPDSHVDLGTVKSLEDKNAELPLFILGDSEKTLYDDPRWVDMCMTCGTCAGACPIAGVDSLDPRKIVRMAFLGMEDDLMTSDWPWKCTLCGRCEYVCPANIEILQLIRRIRSRRERELVPRPIQGGVVTCLERGNNLGIPKEDFILLLEGLGRELEDCCPGFSTPIDVQGARLLVQVNSKEPFAEPDDLKWWWKIFYAAGESWTVSSENWEGLNWGYFSGDDKSMKAMVARIIDNMRRLNCEALLLPESGHAYYATLAGLNRWYPEVLKEFKIYTTFDLLVAYIRQGKILLDRTRHPEKTLYHDPCNYGRKSLRAFGRHYYKEGREITEACCGDVVDMEPSRGASYCCGAGGGAWAMPFTAERVYFGRMKARQINESGARMVTTACPGCRDQIKKSLVQEYNLDVKVKYLWELVADALILPEVLE